MQSHKFLLSRGQWVCATCGLKWRTKPADDPCLPCHDTIPAHLIASADLEGAGLKLCADQQAVARLVNGPKDWRRLYKRTDCLPLWKDGEPQVIQRGAHRVKLLPEGREQCVDCELVFRGHAWGECAGVRQYHWDAWPEGFFTEKQLRAKGLRPGPVRGAVWYSKSASHWLYLYREDEATPPAQPRSEAQRAALERMKEGGKRYWTCRNCGTKADHPAKGGGLCRRCSVAQWASDLLSVGFVVLDTETTGLHFDAEIIQIGVMDSDGCVLFDSYIKPEVPILEVEYADDEEESWRDEPRRTAFGVNRISNAMVADAPSFTEVYLRLQALLANKVVIAYNAAFDEAMLESVCTRAGLDSIQIAGWDCAMLAFAEFYGEPRGRRREWRWQSLSTACDVLDVQDLPAHTAAGDCERTLAVVRSLAVLWKGQSEGALPSRSRDVVP